MYSDLPDGLDDHVEAQEDSTELFDGLCQVIVKLRTEAINGRKGTGIEQTWTDCEDAYLGIDNCNRHEFAGAKWAKPMTMDGPLVAVGEGKSDGKSTAFVRITSRYVDMGAAKINEITTPIDDKPFSATPTPVPTLKDALKEKTPLTTETGQQVMRPQNEDAPSEMVQATVGDLAKVEMEKASVSAEKAENRMYDWMIEGGYQAEKKSLIFDAARIGTGVMKGPFPSFKKSVKRIDKKVQQVVKMIPGFKSISPWNFYPDPACGENIHDGDYAFECDSITESKLLALKKQKLPDGKAIYIADKIDKVIEEGPDKCNIDDAGNPNNKKNKKQYRIWYFTGMIRREQMKMLNVVGVEELPADLVEVSAVITLVNDTIIRANVNPLTTSGDLSYRVLRWSPRTGSWTGVGPGEQISMPQKAVNASTRAMLTNAGLTSGLQIVLDRSQIAPSNGEWVITPNKFWDLVPGATADDIRKIFQVFEFPSRQKELLEMVNHFMKVAEEATNIPLIAQGRQGPNPKGTLGEAQIEDDNAHTLLRSLANQIDNDVQIPLVLNLYEWLLLDDDVPEDEKGDFDINAKGSIILVEKAIQEIVMGQLLAASADPGLGLDREKLMTEYIKSKRIDPRKVMLTEEQKKKISEQPQPEDPTITAAKIRAEAQIKSSAGRDSATVEKSKLDTDRDLQYQDSLNRRAEIQEQGNQEELAMRRELEIYKENNSLKKELDKIKADLAKTQMELKMQEKLAMLNSAAAQVADTEMEPVGRAKTGEAFQA